MNPLKSSSSLYMGFRHYVIAGLAMPIVFGILSVLILGFITTSFPPSNLYQYLPTILSLIGIWLGVIYSARHLRKTFVINNPVMIINYSIIFLVVIQVLFILLPYILKSISPSFALLSLLSYGGNEYFSVYSLIVTLIEIFLFYVLSKKYIINN